MVRHPFAWWIDHAPCDLIIFLDKAGPYDGNTSDDFQRILVLAKPGPYDSLLVHVADQLAASQTEASITLFEPVGTDASETVLQQHAAYHEQLSKLIATPSSSRIVRGADRNQTIAEVTAEYDVLILGAPAENPLRNLFFNSREDTDAAASSCSVLKVKAPRHVVHHRFEMSAEDVQNPETLAAHIQRAQLACHGRLPQR